MSQIVRTSIATTLLLAAPLSTANAQSPFSETLIHDTTTSVEIELSPDTVVCSAADYGALFLKVLIPELAAITLLDHQNVGAGAPCVAAGLCEPGNMPDDLLDECHPTETVDINVQAVRRDSVNHEDETCSTALHERVEVTIRGVTFTHERNAPLGSRPYSDCVSPNTGEDEPQDLSSEGKSDEADDGMMAADASAGGCAAGGSQAPGLVILLVIGAVLAARRRMADL